MASSELSVQIGSRLKEQRKKMGLTQEEAAELLGITTNYYGQVERGERCLSVEKLPLVERGLGLDPDYLLTGELVPERFYAQLVRECNSAQLKELKRLLRCALRLVT